MSEKVHFDTNEVVSGYYFVELDDVHEKNFARSLWSKVIKIFSNDL